HAACDAPWPRSSIGKNSFPPPLLADGESTTNPRLRIGACKRKALRERVKLLSRPLLPTLVKVLCVTGMPGCGKEEFIRVATERGFPVVRMGDTVREEAARKGVGASDEAIGGFAHAERERLGYGIWAERTIT